MSVRLINSNSSPSVLGGIYGTTVTPPASTSSSSYGNGPGAPSPINPVQVIGLVPVFPCCNPANCLGGFSFSMDGACPETFQLSIGGHNYGNFTAASTSSSTIAAAINAILVGSGYSVTCVIISSVCFATISGGTGSAVVSLTYVGGTCIGKVMGTTNITKGGVDCMQCDCRQGLYKADTIPNDQEYTLPVFADFNCTDGYHNDYNTWVFQYPGTYNPIASGDFHLQQNINGVWSNIATLNNTNFGTIIYTGNNCAANYGGYTLNWALVLQNLGAGVYRFTVTGVGTNKVPYCLKSPPFCLKPYDCYAVNGTIKFETVQSGGNWGSVSTQGLSWSLCCVNKVSGATIPIVINDSIRFFGLFGKNKPTLQRDQVKYAPGVIVKNRDEAVKHFTFESSQIPQWLHERFYAYAMMADQLYASDYNINNSDYNFKHFWIVADGDYAPKYVGATRYPKVMDVKFVEGQQFTFRDRCC